MSLKKTLKAAGLAGALLLGQPALEKAVKYLPENTYKQAVQEVVQSDAKAYPYGWYVSEPQIIFSIYDPETQELSLLYEAVVLGNTDEFNLQEIEILKVPEIYKNFIDDNETNGNMELRLAGYGSLDFIYDEDKNSLKTEISNYTGTGIGLLFSLTGIPNVPQSPENPGDPLLDTYTIVIRYTQEGSDKVHETYAKAKLPFEAVPEPATIMLIGIGLAGIAPVFYRKNKKGNK